MYKIFLFLIKKLDNTFTFILEQDGRCTYNVKLRRVRATIVAVENQLVFHILSVYL